MRHRKDLSQEAAAAKVAISVRSARRIEQDPTPPSERPRRRWRNRPDPFAAVWAGEIEPLLRNHGDLLGTTILSRLQQDHPGEYPDRLLRTLQRRMRDWRAVHGPEQEITFRQEHLPGRLGLSDFTDADELDVTVGGVRLRHLLYHYRLSFSGWEHVAVVEGGESFAALAAGLQDALWLAGGVPEEHRTDSLSAAFRNLARDEVEDLTRRYAELCAHYRMQPTRNNRGEAHENGSIESSHRHLKRALDQALLLRGTREFADRSAYDSFVIGVVAGRNARRAREFALERPALQPLPAGRSASWTEATVQVTSTSTFSLKGILYSVPSRLIGHQLRVRLHADRLECFLGTSLVAGMPRGRKPQGGGHVRVIDYRHLIGGLKRKPGALKRFAMRDELFPRPAYRRAWEALDAALPSRQACRVMVGLLDLAARHACEADLARRLDTVLDAGLLPDLAQLTAALAPEPDAPPRVAVVLPTAASYDALLTGGRP
jgi:hypothetical protein